MQSKESQKKTIASRSQSIDEFLVNSRLSEDQSKKESRENYASAAPEKINQHERNIRINEPEPIIRSDHKSIVLQPDDDCNNWWKQPVTTYALNDPIVQSNLRRLVDTEEAIIDDYEFMMSLRANVGNDFHEKLAERVTQREAKEIERTKQLILRGQYNAFNCPKKLMPLHSEVLILDLPDETVKLDRLVPKYDGPIFNINRKVNAVIRSRRNRIRTVRRKNFEYAMRHVLKELSEELKYDENRAVQVKIKTIHESKKKHPKHFAFISKMVRKVKSMFKRHKKANV